MDRALHKLVSNLPTPPEYIEEDYQGNEYPKSEYMRAIAQKYYNIISWEIIDKNIVMGPDSKPAWYVVHGRLQWMEGDDIVHVGDMVAAHRIQYTKNGDFLDLGNDIKAANTDCWKKALNFHLNICDDIYRWQDPELTEEDINELEQLSSKLPNEKQSAMINKIDLLAINKLNVETIKRKLGG